MTEVGETDDGAAFEETSRILAEEVDEGLFTRGAQVAVAVNGQPVVSLVAGDDGRGRPMEADTVFRVYCTIKPVTALAVARLVDDGRIGIDEPLAGHLPDVRALADGTVTLRHVMSHTAGLHRPMALELELMPPEKRPAHVADVPRPTGWAVGQDAAYSEWFGWHVLGRLIEAVTGEVLRDHLRSTVIEPLGLDDTWVGMTDDEYGSVLDRLGLNHDLRQLQGYPLLLERGRRMCTEVNPAHGGYSTAVDLCRLYAAIGAQVADGDDPALPSGDTLRTFTSSARPVTYDQVLDRECAYGLGFMTELSTHHFGSSPSPEAFGHSGNVGSSFAWADPSVGLAAAVVYNGVVDPDSAFLRRPALVRAIYDDVATLTGSVRSDETNPAPAEASLRRRRFGRDRR